MREELKERLVGREFIDEAGRPYTVKNVLEGLNREGLYLSVNYDHWTDSSGKHHNSYGPRVIDLETHIRKHPESLLEEGSAEDILGRSIHSFNFSTRVLNRLSDFNVKTIRELVNNTEGGYLSLRGFGPTSLKEIKDFLSVRGLSLRENQP